MGESWEFRVSRNMAGEKSGVVEALLTEGLGPSRPGPPLPSSRRGLDAWEVLVVANASVFLASFVQRSGERAADVLFDLLTRFKHQVSGDGTVVVEDDAGADRLELNVRTVTIDEIRALLSQRAGVDRSPPSGRNDT